MLSELGEINVIAGGHRFSHNMFCLIFILGTKDKPEKDQEGFAEFPKDFYS